MCVHTEFCGQTGKGWWNFYRPFGWRGPGDVTSNFYDNYLSDIGLMKDLGMQNFRFSISWPRIFPEGSGQVNERGLAFYHKVLDALKEAGITPHVTLYHWDLPQVYLCFILQYSTLHDVF
jgi:beta-glucosidase